ncbi:MAG TPA: right-handed parallel beta-helix repeat-containing protein, partial [Micromonosporaceae bacterium]
MWNLDARRRLPSRRAAALLAGAAVVVIALGVAVAVAREPGATPSDRGALSMLVPGACPSGCASTSPPCSAPAAGTCPSPTASPNASASPSASSSASPSASRSPRPSPKPAPTKRAGGKPGPANTGVPAGTKLKVVTGDQVYATPNMVVSGVDVHGFVQITAKHVTIKDSIIRGGPNPRCNSAVVWIRADDGASATIEDSEIDPTHPSPCLDGIWATNATLRRMNIHGAVDGVKAYDHVTVEDSYIHDLSW